MRVTVSGVSGSEVTLRYEGLIEFLTVNAAEMDDLDRFRRVE